MTNQAINIVTVVIAFFIHTVLQNVKLTACYVVYINKHNGGS